MYAYAKMDGDIDMGDLDAIIYDRKRYEAVFALEEETRREEFEKMRAELGAELQGVRSDFGAELQGVLQTLKHVSAEQQRMRAEQQRMRAEQQTTRAELQGLRMELLKQGQIMNDLVNLNLKF